MYYERNICKYESMMSMIQHFLMPASRMCLNMFVTETKMSQQNLTLLPKIWWRSRFTLAFA